jgi:hypothetical protein
MQILSHRGFWFNNFGKNTLESFEYSFKNSFGIETDIRDYDQNLIISHDVPDHRCVSFDNLIDVYQRDGKQLPLAINVKADGLQRLFTDAIRDVPINYFVFDMSIPDALAWIAAGHPVFLRMSEYEPRPVLFDKCAGLWIDPMVDEEWIKEDLLSDLLLSNKSVCLVSPELHRRDYRKFWDQLSSMALKDDPKLMICTDFPKDCNDFFNK